MWGSAFAASLSEIFRKMGGSGLRLLDPYKESVTVTGESRGPWSVTPTCQGPGRGMKNEGDGSRWFSLYFTAPPPHPDDRPTFWSQDLDPTRLRTRLFTPQSPFSQAVLDIFTSRFTCARNFNFTRGLCLHKDYVASREFMAWKGVWCRVGGGSRKQILPIYTSGSLGPALAFIWVLEEVRSWSSVVDGVGFSHC